MIKKGFIYLVLFILLSACAGEPEQDFTNQKIVLEQNQTKWESHHITHYRMSVNYMGYGAFDATIEVKDGNIVSVAYAQGQDGFAAAYGYDNLFTVPELFAYLSQSYSKNPQPSSIKVTYDPALGYPSSIYIEPWREPCCQDYTLEINNFQVLP